MQKPGAVIHPQHRLCSTGCGGWGGMPKMSLAEGVAEISALVQMVSCWSCFVQELNIWKPHNVLIPKGTDQSVTKPLVSASNSFKAHTHSTILRPTQLSPFQSRGITPAQRDCLVRALLCMVSAKHSSPSADPGNCCV